MQLSSQFVVKSKTAAFKLWDIKEVINTQKIIKSSFFKRSFKKKIILYKTSVGLLCAIVLSAKDLCPNSQALGGQD